MNYSTPSPSSHSLSTVLQWHKFLQYRMGAPLAHWLTTHVLAGKADKEGAQRCLQLKRETPQSRSHWALEGPPAEPFNLAAALCDIMAWRATAMRVELSRGQTQAECPTSNTEIRRAGSARGNRTAEQPRPPHMGSLAERIQTTRCTASAKAPDSCKVRKVSWRDGDETAHSTAPTGRPSHCWCNGRAVQQGGHSCVRSCSRRTASHRATAPAPAQQWVPNLAAQEQMPGQLRAQQLGSGAPGASAPSAPLTAGTGTGGTAASAPPAARAGAACGAAAAWC